MFTLLLKFVLDAKLKAQIVLITLYNIFCNGKIDIEREDVS